MLNMFFMVRKIRCITLYNRIHLKDGDYRVLEHAQNMESDILPCKDLSVLKNKKGFNHYFCLLGIGSLLGNSKFGRAWF